jgi:NosR/NirI family nitrous oxide reductase transcriptional regulator
VFPKAWVRQLPARVHDALRRVRYLILVALVLLSFVSIEWAERLAEVEPFKTTWIVGVFNRDWYLVLYWWALLFASLFVFRFFCRYVCPLGAALSIGTALRIIGIRRKEFCTRCKICARNCHSLAIDPRGQINKYECLYCMECEQKYHDDRVCPPLAVARRRAEREADKSAQQPVAAASAAASPGAGP